MSWTNPKTWVAGETVTAALLNTHLRDNLLATAAAVMTVAGDMVYATAANTLARLAKGSAGQFLRMNALATAPEWATLTPTSGYFLGAVGVNRHVESGTSASELIPQGELNVNDDAFTFVNSFASTPSVAVGLQHNGNAFSSAGVIIKWGTLGTTGVTLQKANNVAGGLTMISYYIAEGPD